jgi:hypothetical protein
MNSRKLDKIFEDQEKMIQVTLSSDPAKKGKKYKGFLVNEGPVADTVATGVGKTLSTIGGAYKSLGDINKKFSEFSKGDLSVLAELGEGMLANVIDRQTTKVSLFGKRGYDTVLLNDAEIIRKLNDYSSTGEVKEGFLQKVDRIIQIFEQGEQGQFQMGGPGVTPSSAALTKYVPGTMVPYKQKETNQPKTTQPQQQTTPQRNINFNGNNLYFKLSNAKKYGAMEMYILTPLRNDVKQALTAKGIQNVALTRSVLKGGVVNNDCTVYFYYDARNVIPQLTTSNLKFSYDAKIKAYLIDSRIKKESGPDSTLIKYPLNITEENFDIKRINPTTHTITFRMKPGAKFAEIKNRQERNELRSRFFKEEGGDFIYPQLSGRYLTNVTGDSIVPNGYVVDMQKIAISYGAGSLRVSSEGMKKEKEEQINPAAKTEPQQPVTSPATPETEQQMNLNLKPNKKTKPKVSKTKTKVSKTKRKK